MSYTWLSSAKLKIFYFIFYFTDFKCVNCHYCEGFNKYLFNDYYHPPNLIWPELYLGYERGGGGTTETPWCSHTLTIWLTQSRTPTARVIKGGGGGQCFLLLLWKFLRKNKFSSSKKRKEWNIAMKIQKKTIADKCSSINLVVCWWCMSSFEC